MQQRYPFGMSHQIAVRLEPAELAALDAEVASGRAKSRSAALRQSIAYLQRHRQYQDDAAIMARLHSQGQVLYPDLESIPSSDLSGIDP